MRAQFRPTLGARRSTRLEGMLEPDDNPNLHGEHHGSAYQTAGTTTRRRTCAACSAASVRGKLSRIYCGGSRKRARASAQVPVAAARHR